MEFLIYSDSAAFTERVSPLLYKNEDIHSLFLGVLGQIQANQYEEYFLAIAETGHEIVGACLMTPPHALQLVVFRHFPEIEKEIAERLQNLGIEISGIVGEQETSSLFAKAWTRQTEEMVKTLMNQGLYRIDAVYKGLRKSEGSWRIASKKDGETLEKWYRLFEVETGIGRRSSQAEATHQISIFLERKEVYVWEVDGVAVSCMKKSRPSKNGITVSFVFTPESWRGNGYARTLVAEVTDELLLEFDFVMLYTDLNNATANKIYREIGYVQIANPVHLVFEEE
ncbi:GNAT family N-acetyltransferase [Planococcus antarcticus DSM 14505]|uniref:GNAT family N-acetyltransferase n=1 Tax=Planococcus antarcticus DSM 14505 TaxID=1185653 RepID=A0ABM6D0S9_9BACL|nr:GNAT family N-acetyltransferase [Planococcus antarcticus]ANU08927.1 GNAT family N-acetyltransferase [Planococcus antarcticus DSM 14505]